MLPTKLKIFPRMSCFFMKIKIFVENTESVRFLVENNESLEFEIG